MSQSLRRLKDPILERYLADALAPAAKQDLERVLEESEPDRARVAELRADSQAFLTLHPPGQMAARYEKQAAKKPWWQLPSLLAPLGAAMALATVLLISRPPEDPYLTKGKVALTVHRREGVSSVQVRQGEALKAGDAIRFEVVAPGPGFVAVVSRDPSGQVTVYHPYGGRAAAPYDSRAPLLATAIELDQVVGIEEIYALYSKQAFPLEGVLEAIAAGKNPGEALPAVDVARLSLLKR
ncbi:MAG: hypothetical protein ACYC8T_04620 [Myxococcaceae bacterium]